MATWSVKKREDFVFGDGQDRLSLLIPYDNFKQIRTIINDLSKRDRVDGDEGWYITLSGNFTEHYKNMEKK